VNRYILLRRIRGPIYLLTFGVTALLAEFHILSFGRSWPLYLIVAGLLALAERGLLATLPPPSYGMPGYGGYPAPSYPGPNPPPAPGTAIVPTTVTDIEGRL
jgi:hypothetical protein